MSLSPVIGTEVPETANGIATPVSPEIRSENGPHTHPSGPLKCGGSRVPCPGQESEDGSLGETENHMDVERGVCDGEGRLNTDTDHNSMMMMMSNSDVETHTATLHTPHAHDPSLPTATCTGDTESSAPHNYTELSDSSHSDELPGAALQGDSPQHTDSPPRGGPVSADTQQKETVEACSREMEKDGEKEKQDEEDDEKEEKERKWQHARGSSEYEVSGLSFFFFFF